MEQIEGQKKTTKVPYQINGEKANSTNPRTWTSFYSTWEHEHKFSGIGYVVTENDPYTVIDLDDCIENGVINPEAQSLINAFDSYTEYSQSGKGIHIFIKARKPGNRSKNTEKGIEIYDSKRFIVMTRNPVEGMPLDIQERQDTLNYIYDMYFAATDKTEPQQLQKSASRASPS
ncbi:hypothetical protein, partial [Luteimonas abyssi]|uniref:hypothetical protein n=1 Tax=Luteimonas abyssi TaxID=1247514 RepID=UPI00192E65ED